MNDEQRKIIQDSIARATKSAKNMPPETARRRLIKEGVYTEDGALSARYGGKAAAHG